MPTIELTYIEVEVDITIANTTPSGTTRGRFSLYTF